MCTLGKTQRRKPKQHTNKPFGKTMPLRREESEKERVTKMKEAAGGEEEGT
jgi:hypothetical protein